MKALKTLFLTLVVSVVAVLPAMAAEDIWFSPPLAEQAGNTVIKIPGADGDVIRQANGALPVYFNPANHPWQEYGALTFGYLQLATDEDRREFSIQLFEHEIRRQMQMFAEKDNGFKPWYAGRTDAFSCDDSPIGVYTYCWGPEMIPAGTGGHIPDWYEDAESGEWNRASFGGVAQLNPNVVRAGEEWRVHATALHEFGHAAAMRHLFISDMFGELAFSIMGQPDGVSIFRKGYAELSPLDELVYNVAYPPAGPECAIPFVYQDGAFRIRFEEVWSGSYQFTGEITLVGLATPTPDEMFDQNTPMEWRPQLSALGFVVTELLPREEFVYSVTPCGTPLVQSAIRLRIRAALFGQPDSDFWLYLQNEPGVALRITGLVPVE